MARKPLTQEQAIEFYTELSRRVRVGAYVELEHDGSFPPDDGTPESTTLESLYNLEEWAARAGLEFVGNEQGGYTLEPMSAETRAARQAAQEWNELDRAQQHAENERLAHLPSVREDEA